jgi:hypothetical protein
MYQIAIYSTNALINFLIYDKNATIAILVNFVILSIYHSFYSFNNKWHHKKINVVHRINMCEKLWPYYIGFGIVPTILYLNSRNLIMMSLYNFYIILSIAIPFLVKEKKAACGNYPKINLVIFSYVLYIIYSFTKKYYRFVR